jgi:S-formylglutathione hydrolase FrmB
VAEPWGTPIKGRFANHTIPSEALRDNHLGDPSDRPLIVYTPPRFQADSGRRYPSIYLIQGLTGQVDMWWNRSAFRPTLPELVDGLFANHDVPPTIVVFVDAWTSLGGSQYVNSPGTGRYLDYLCDDVVGFVDANYPTLAHPGNRAINGKSSGGYGAMVVPMLRPDIFGALGTHAGDALFEFCYLPDLAASARLLREKYEGSFERFWQDFRSRPAFSKQDDGTLLNAYCMAACYSAEEDGTVTLPFDLQTGRFRDDVWRRWLALDPVRMAPDHADALRALKGAYIDAGRQDEYYLDVGAVAFAAELEKLGVDHRLELFDAKHGGIEYRYPIALRYLAEKIAG